MDHFNSVLFMLITGMVLLCFGYQKRETNWGIAVMWVGAMAMLGTMFYAIFSAIGL
jgi:hypothetical protein